MEPVRTIFMGTAPLAVPSLRALLSGDSCTVLAVVTQPDRPKGRDLRPQPSAVKIAALEQGLPVLQPEKAREPAFIEELRALNPALIVVAAYGQILPHAILELPAHGCLNVHASLLPRWRGAAPIQWALLEGDPETGVTIMKIDAGLDTGDMLARRATPITEADTAETLHDRLADLGAGLLAETIPGYLAGQIRLVPQPAEGVTYARKLTKQDGELDWREPAARLFNRIRALTPWPGAFTRLDENGRPALLKIWAARVANQNGLIPGEILGATPEGITVACGRQALCLTEVQREGGRRLAAREFLAGHALKSGARLLGPA